MTGLVDLQKAQGFSLPKEHPVRKLLELYNKIPLHQDFKGSDDDFDTAMFVWCLGMEKLFSGFQKDFVVISRKQLEDLLVYPRNTKSVAVYDFVKNLLTGEKLKESSKPRNVYPCGER
jgi:hypothetical protein